MAVVQKKHVPITTQSSKYVPVCMLEVEIGQSLPTLSAVDAKKERTYTTVDAPPLPRYVQVIHKELLMLHRKGLLYGPLAYLRNRWEVRRLT